MSQIICGDALTELRNLPGESVHMCVTSPPYWGLRDYGTVAQIWGDDGTCAVHPNPRGDTEYGFDHDWKKNGFCTSCKAWRGSLGLEPTPELYVQHLVEIFREVKRVLRKDGTLWLNLGDSYAHDNPSGPQGKNGERVSRTFTAAKAGGNNHGLKPKDLVGIPWRVAFALQADGWYLRSDIIWAKPNPMPESVTDRPTKSHEYIFLLSKSAKYYFDQEAVKEPNSPTTGKWGRSVITKTAKAQGDGRHGKTGFMGREINHEETLDKYYINGRNLRSVWTITTKPFKEAHFATFPPELPERCIKAGCPAGGAVLDPFFGAGTTGLVAKRLGREFIGIELNLAYCDMAEKRINAQASPLPFQPDYPASPSQVRLDNPADIGERIAPHQGDIR